MSFKCLEKELIMKTTLVIFAILVFTACSDQIIVRTDFDRNVNVATFNTFSWLDKHAIEERNNPLYYNELNDKRIRDAVAFQLTAKGYRPTGEQARLKVHYHIVIEDKTQVRSDAYSPYWINSRSDLFEYREGTIIIDLMDAEKDALIWRGWAISALDDTQEMREDLIHDAIAKIFSKLPPAVPSNE
jgi:hypothetical protein